MQGLPSDLYNLCRNTLCRCREFQNYQVLRSVFVTEPLLPFRMGLPLADSPEELVDLCLGHLIDRRLNDGRPVLPFFIAALRDRYEPGDVLRSELGVLASAVQTTLASSSAHLAQVGSREMSRHFSREPVDGDSPEDLSMLPHGLQRLLSIVERMFRDRIITASQQSYLTILYRETRPGIPIDASQTMQLLRATSMASPTAIRRIPVDDMERFLCSLEKHIRQFAGETNMTASSSSPISHTAYLFTKMARLLAGDLSALAEHHNEWPDLVIGDEVTQESIASLQAMQTRMGYIANLLEKFTPPQSLRCLQVERNGFTRSAVELADLFEELDGHLVNGTVPMHIVDEMERHLDDLLYYANCCLLRLNDLGRLATKTITSIS